MKRLVLLIITAGLLFAGSPNVEVTMVPVNGPNHVGAVATKLIIYDAVDQEVTGYEVRATVCHPTQHGCFYREISAFAEVEGNFGMATVTLPVPPSMLAGEPDVTPLPNASAY